MIPINHPRFSSRRRSAFTLVEMITVVGIIALLVALATPALVDVIRSTRLNSSGDSLSNRLSLAQQSAVAKSTEVEMRFYQYIDPSNSDAAATPVFYAYQVVETPNSRDPRAISEVYYLDSGTVLSNNQTLSPMLQTAVAQTPDSRQQYVFKPSTGVAPSSVTYSALRFYPDGSCRVLTGGTAGQTAAASAIAYTLQPLTQTFLTIVESRDLLNTGVPTNFYCMQIDSYTGKVRTYRP
jgi:uncharacterized protein (TIGR02596 family)